MHLQQVTASRGSGRAIAGELIERARATMQRAGLLLDPASLLNLMRFRDLRRTYYDGLWRETSRAMGAECSAWRGGYTMIRRGDLATLVRRAEVMLDSHLLLNVMGDKALTYELLAMKGQPMPQHCLFSLRDIERAEKFLTRLGRPIVVKPASGTGGGRGVTTGITTRAALHRASRQASRHDRRLLAEEQIAGASYRLLFLDGRFIDAIRRDPPNLTGDGISTIRQLVRRENHRRLTSEPATSLSPLMLDLDCRNQLRSQGLSPTDRLPRDATIQVKRAVNENSSAQNHNVRSSVHEQTIADLGRLVQDLGVAFAGVDIIAGDIGMPLARSGGIVSEINTTPALHHHYLIANPGAGVPVAQILLQHMFEHKRGVMAL
jgi:cyanophycin synthetase